MPMSGPGGHYLPILYIRSCLHKNCTQIIVDVFFAKTSFLRETTFLCHLVADSPVLAPRALVMVTLMQPRDLEMKQTLFIALFQPDPQCKLPDYRSFMAVLCYCRSRTFLLPTFKNTEIQHLQCINVYKENDVKPKIQNYKKLGRGFLGESNFLLLSSGCQS